MPILTTFHDNVLQLEISRPEKRNTLDKTMLESLTEAFTRADADETVLAVFLHAQPGIFCAGGDLKEQLTDLSADSTTPTGRFIEALKNCRKPVVACVAGPAVGLGVTMLYYCDLVYASASSLFSLPFTALGLTPRYGASLLALLNAGYHKAAEKILLSEPISANEALAMRLVSAVYADEDVFAQADARVRRLALMSPAAVQGAKKLLQSAWSTRLADITHKEAGLFAVTSKTPEAQEACAAFLEGRMPSFKAH